MIKYNRIITWLVIGIITYGCIGNDLPQQPPNIILLFADDQRASTINILGNEEISTPNLDRLVKNGLTFTNAYIMGGTSPAVCAPSRAMLMTGKNMYNLTKKGMWNFPITAADTTFPELLRMNGYRTFGIGKQHNGREVFARGFSNGGHLMFGGMSSHYDIPAYDFQYDSLYPEEKKYRVVDKHSTELYANDAVQFIKAYDQTDPFLLYVAFQAPHDPREMPEEFLEMYPEETITVPGNFLPHHPFDNGELLIRDEMLADFPRTESEVRSHIAAYYAMITHMDSEIGKIINTLDEKGILEECLIIFTSDNGLAVGQHGLMGKQNLYEHSIKVPLILSGPDIPAGKSTDAFCYIHDIYPTICEYLGLSVPGTVESRGFMNSIRDPEQPHRDFLIYGYRNFQRAIRKDNWKLIEYYVKEERNTQLFNLEMDPLETRNLSEFAGNQAELNELRDLLIKESRHLNDTIGFWNWLE